MSKQTQLINKDVHIIGHNFMYPLGSTVRVIKKVENSKSKKMMYQCQFHHKLTGTGHEVAFDVTNGEHEYFDESDAYSCYNVKLDISVLA